MTRRNLRRIAVSLMFVLAGMTAGTVEAASRQTAAPRRSETPVRPSVWELQQPQPSQQNEFEPLKNLPPVQQEHLPAAPLVMGAYAFVWVALLVYVWSVWRRVGAVERELADLRRRTERKA